MEQIINEQASLYELIDGFLRQVGHRYELESEPSVVSKPLPPNFRPLKFTRSTMVHLGDIEAVIDGYIVELFGCDHLLELRDFYGPLFPRMRLYEYVMQICRYAEGHYLKNNEFFASTFALWRKFLDSADQAEAQPFGLSDRDLKQMSSAMSAAKTRFAKVAEILVNIGGLLRIPRITDGVPLRFIISYLYVLLCDRLYLLDRFDVLLGQIKHALVQQLAARQEALAAAKLEGAKSDKKSLVDQVTGDSPPEEA